LLNRLSQIFLSKVGKRFSQTFENCCKNRKDFFFKKKTNNWSLKITDLDFGLLRITLA
jgi:hypothetical protein